MSERPPGMTEAPARLRLDVACNDPDNGLFAHRAEALQVTTWDGELIELELVRERGPRFAEKAGAIRLLRHDWPILASTEWYGNWCWNAYWLAPETAAALLAAVKRSRMFHCSCGPSQLYENWNDDGAALNRDLWLANMWGRHGIGALDTPESEK